MVTIAELLRFPAFADLPEDQLAWFVGQTEELNLKPGEVYARQGDLPEHMFVLVEGEFEAQGEFNGEQIVIRGEAGNVTGALPFSRMKTYTVSLKAVTRARILRFPASNFPQLVQRMPELTRRLVGMMTDRVREATRFEQQRDRLVSLGKLSAGLAHELNNPAAAAKRAAAQLRQTLQRIKDASHELGRRELTLEQKSEIEKIEASLAQRDGPPPDALTISDLEEQIDSLLRAHGHNNLWQLAAELAQRGVKPSSVEALFNTLDADTARVALMRIAASLEIASLLNEVESSTSRISDLVRAIKEYTYMDQSPVQNVDVVKSLETTLIIMTHKLKRGIDVKRNYEPVPLLVNSFGSELNQVWTNLIDNAIDAMNGHGELRLRTYRDDGSVVVEIGDNGPGISPEIRFHIFDPFFTTKGVGEGTGLGLDTAQRIVKKHRGHIQVDSKPGDTRFQVRLPLAGSKGH